MVKMINVFLARLGVSVLYTPNGPHFPKKVTVVQNFILSGKDGVCNQELPLAARK